MTELSRMAESKWRGRRSFGVLALLLVGATSLSACSSSSSSSGGAPSTEVTIGFIADTSGVAASFGTSYSNGVKMAVKQLNEGAYLGKGRTIKLNQIDEGSDPARGVSAMNGMINHQNVSAVICCALTPVAAALKPLALKNQLPIFIYGATLPGLNEPPYAYRTIPVPVDDIEPMVTKIVQKLHPSKVAFAVNSDNDGMQSMYKAAENAYKVTGVQNVGTAETLVTDSNMTSTADKLIAMHPDIISITMTGASPTPLLSSLRSRGFEGPVTFQYLSSGTVSQVGVKAAQNIFFPLDFNPSSDNPTIAKFVSSYKAAYGDPPDAYAAAGYETVSTIAEAAKSVLDAGGAVSRGTVAKAASEITKEDGTLYGHVTFSNGQIAIGGHLFGTISPTGDVEEWK